MPFILSDDLRNALLNYLGTKPWQEVNPAMSALASLPPYSSPPPAPDAPAAPEAPAA